MLSQCDGIDVEISAHELCAGETSLLQATKDCTNCDSTPLTWTSNGANIGCSSDALLSTDFEGTWHISNAIIDTDTEQFDCSSVTDASFRYVRPTSSSYTSKTDGVGTSSGGTQAFYAANTYANISEPNLTYSVKYHPSLFGYMDFTLAPEAGETACLSDVEFWVAQEKRNVTATKDFSNAYWASNNMELLVYVDGALTRRVPYSPPEASTQPLSFEKRVVNLDDLCFTTEKDIRIKFVAYNHYQANTGGYSGNSFVTMALDELKVNGGCCSDPTTVNSNSIEVGPGQYTVSGSGCPSETITITTASDCPDMIECPEDADLMCGASIDPLDLGRAKRAGMGFIDYSDEQLTTEAPILIKRTWRYAEGSENVTTECDVLIIPDDFNSLTCGQNADVSVTGEPCPVSSGTVSFSDEIIASDPVVIRRTWSHVVNGVVIDSDIQTIRELQTCASANSPDVLYLHNEGGCSLLERKWWPTGDAAKWCLGPGEVREFTPDVWPINYWLDGEYVAYMYPSGYSGSIHIFFGSTNLDVKQKYYLCEEQGQSVTLDVDAYYESYIFDRTWGITGTSYEWRNASGQVVSTSRTYEATEPGIYTFTVTSGNVHCGGSMCSEEYRVSVVDGCEYLFEECVQNIEVNCINCELDIYLGPTETESLWVCSEDGENLFEPVRTASVKSNSQDYCPLTYEWTGPGIVSADVNQSSILVDKVGFYRVVTTDCFGCTDEAVFEVKDSGLEVSIGVGGDAECIDDEPLQLTAVPTGGAVCNGTQTTTYLWSTGEVTESINITQPGTYSVTIKDCIDCEAYAEIVVEGCLSLGSTVFVDTNNDGFLNSNESGIANVLVSLYRDTDTDEVAETLVAQQRTDALGNYFFDNLAGGGYQVVVTPDDRYPRATRVDTRDNIDNNSDGVQSAVGELTRSVIIGLSDGDEPTNETGLGSNQDDANDDSGNMTVDFGFVAIGSIGSTVFIDTDNDGTFDEGEESVLNGVRVDLYSLATGTPTLVGTTRTVGGNYLFDNLLPGDYEVRVIPDSGYPVSSTTTNESDDAIDNDDNGIQDATGDVTVSPVITLTYGSEPTNESGLGGDQDSADDSSGNMTVDFGFVPLMSLGSTVWSDDNDNGFHDDGEQGIDGMTLVLSKIGDSGFSRNVRILRKAGQSGIYFFDNLEAGQYYLRSQVPAGYIGSSEDIFEANNVNGVNMDGDNNGESDESGLLESRIITLEYGKSPMGSAESYSGGTQDDDEDSYGDMTLDMGLVPSLSVGSTIFADVDRDGLKGAGEPGLSGIDLELYVKNEDGSYTELNVSVSTDSEGNYEFTGLRPGEYQVRFTPPSSYPRITPRNVLLDNGMDNDSNGEQPDGDFEEIRSVNFELSVGDEPVDGDADGQESGSGSLQDSGRDSNGDMTIDFGLVPIMSIGSQTFIDNDDNGRYDVEVDMVLPNVNIKVYADSGDGLYDSTDDVLVGEVTSDSDGEYIVTNLLPGDYFVVSSPNDGQWFSSRPTVTQDVLTDDGMDHGVKVGDDYVSPMITLTTNGEGSSTQEVMPGGDLDDSESELNGDMTVDFGFVPQLSLGSTAFYDRDGDSYHDADEPGINGIEITLYNDSDQDFTAMTFFTRTIDGVPGSYFVEGLRPGNYRMTGKITDDYEGISSVTTLANTDTDRDNNADDGDALGSFVVPEFLLQGVQPTGTDEDGTGGTFDDNEVGNTYRDLFGNMTVDIGVIGTAPEGILAVGNLVFYDKNDNGMFDGDDSGLAGVTVNLYEVENGVQGTDILRTVTTDDDGFYVFDKLHEGNYRIEVVPLADYPHSSGEALIGNYSPHLDKGYNGVRPARFSNTETAVVDDVDDGFQEGSYGIVKSVVFELTEGGEPGANDGENGVGSNSDDVGSETTTNLTVDFGFTRRDKDNDALFDHEEDKNKNGIADPDEKDYCNPDTDNDRVWDGPECGKDELTDQTDENVNCDITPFSRVCNLDSDPTTTTNPLNPDTDGDGIRDGDEDTNFNGRVDIGGPDGDETDPNVADNSGFVGTAVYLEGALAGEASRVVGNTVQYQVSYNELMNTSLNASGLLPGQTPKSLFATPTEKGQPYGIAPWNLSDDSDMVNYASDVVDWVLVAIRSTMDGDNMCAKAGLLHSDGTISYVDAFSCALVEGDEYHIAIMHRNHLPIISPLVPVENGTLTYDFRASDSYKKGFNYSQKLLEDDRYVMMSGNAEQLGLEMADINSNDVRMWKKEFGLFDTYMCSDTNMDGATSPNDKMIMLMNYGFTSSISN